MKEKTTQWSIRVPESVRLRIEIIAMKEGRTPNNLINEILIKYLEKKEGRTI